MWADPYQPVFFSADLPTTSGIVRPQLCFIPVVIQNDAVWLPDFNLEAAIAQTLKDAGGCPATTSGVLAAEGQPDIDTTSPLPTLMPTDTVLHPGERVV